MPAEGPASEYGGKIQKNTVYPKDAAALTASEKMRLVYRTGQDTDPEAPVNEQAFRDEFGGIRG